MSVFILCIVPVGYSAPRGGHGTARQFLCFPIAVRRAIQSVLETRGQHACRVRTTRTQSQPSCNLDELSATAAHRAQPDSIMQKVLVALMLSGAAALAPRSVAPKTMARRQLGSAFLGGAAALVATTASAYEGVYSMEIVKAKDVVLDEEALRSGAVQSALGEFKNYAVGIVRLREALAKDDQFDTSKVLKKDYDYVKVRATFNKLEPIWDEDTQKGVDRLMRGVLQDITEAEAAGKYNEAGARTPKKLTLLTSKLDKLDGELRKLFGYCVTK